MARTASPSSSKPGVAGRDGAGVAGALAELLALGNSRGWVVSCYQKLEPNDRAGEKYRIKLKNRLRRAAERLDILGFSHADREAVTGELERVETFFAHSSNLPGAAASRCSRPPASSARCSCRTCSRAAWWWTARRSWASWSR